MNKNIILASGITILFLGLAIQPSVATIQPKNIDIKPNDDDIEGLVAQIRIVINEILQDYGHIPVIRTLYNKIVDILGLFGRILFCVFLIVLVIPLFIIFVIMGLFLQLGLIENYDIGENLFWSILAICLGLTFFCSNFKSPLKSLSNIYSIDISNSSTLTGLDECPCMQE